METLITLLVTHSKPIDGLAEIAAGRLYTLDGVDDVGVAADLRIVDIPEVKGVTS